MKQGLLSSLLLVLAVPLAAAAAEPRGFLHASPPGGLVAAGHGRQAEVVSFDSDLVPWLLRSLPDESLRIADWPVAPGERADVILTRHEVYAPDARVLVVEGQGMREVPRSRLAFFWGAAERDDETRVFVAVDPDSGDMDGFVQAGGATNEIHPLRAVPGMKVRAGSHDHLIAAAELFRDQAGETGVWNCGQNDASLDFLDFQREATSPAPRSVTANLASLYTATLAIDTDNEFMSLKFADNPTTATNYIASLIAAMTAIYERDLNVRLLQGTVLLRPSTTADPYTQPISGNADPTKLNEFSNYWNATYGGVSRTIALLLSGKQPQPPTGSGGASGIAWIHGLCSKSVGYSVNQVIVPGTSPTSADVQVVAHEVGHNFGSPHTHCYKTGGVLDPVDFCYMGEGGCYSGATSCPAPQTINGVTNVTGTLMSYCHVPAKSGGVDGCSVKTVFHPRTVAFVQTDLNAAVNVCLFPALPAPTVTTVAPDSGTTLGGTSVTLTGTGFQAGAIVTFDG
ncbi:MAG TPA: M12 family metallo-peptidase, partial [Nocardioidaceae bacterium]|nr:M12 family metallo-peptidase [Nocardioidaceae bacterium]